MENIYIGQKVICVDDASTIPGYKTQLSKGQIYTIFSIGRCAGCGVKVVCLDENNVTSQSHCSCGSFSIGRTEWRATRFAPLSEKTAESESFATETLKNIEHEIIETYTVK